MPSKHCKRFRLWLHFICLLLTCVFVWLICFPPISIWTAALVPPPWAGDLSGRMKSNCPVGSHFKLQVKWCGLPHTFLKKKWRWLANCAVNIFLRNISDYTFFCASIFFSRVPPFCYALCGKSLGGSYISGWNVGHWNWQIPSPPGFKVGTRDDKGSCDSPYWTLITLSCF